MKQHLPQQHAPRAGAGAARGTSATRPIARPFQIGARLRKRPVVAVAEAECGELAAATALSNDAAQHQQQQQQQHTHQHSHHTHQQPQQPQAPEAVRARAAARRREQLTYRFSAIAASLGVTALAVGATVWRFSRLHAQGAAFPWLDVAATLALVAGGAIGMEAWARYAHRALWHDYEPGWALHKSHHEPRVGPFEANDVFAVMNAVPAMGLCLYGFLTPTLAGSLCFGAGLGITLFGISYMFVHDGLVHKRFPVGPIARLPAMRRVVAAHKLHHGEKHRGVPWGLFLGPQELEAIGAGPDLDRLVAEMEAADAAADAAAADAAAAAAAASAAAA